MVDQATVNGPRTFRSPGPEGMFEGVESFGNNLTTLGALQARLAALDLRESLRIALPGLIALGIAILLVPAALVVGLFGLAQWLAAVLAMKSSSMMMIVGAVGIGLGAGAGAFGAWRASHSFTSFRRSRDELLRNIAWVRTVLAQSGR